LVGDSGDPNVLEGVWEFEFKVDHWSPLRVLEVKSSQDTLTVVVKELSIFTVSNPY
jgi:hypothetical protein